MKTSDFNQIYNNIIEERIDIVNDQTFNCNMWFWLQLTELQHNKMFDLLVLQGNKVTNGEIRLANGTRIKRI